MSVLLTIIYSNIYIITVRSSIFSPETSGDENNIFQDIYVNTMVADALAKQKAGVSAAAELSSVSVMWHCQTVHRFTPNVLYDTSLETS